MKIDFQPTNNASVYFLDPAFTAALVLFVALVTFATHWGEHLHFATGLVSYAIVSMISHRRGGFTELLATLLMTPTATV